MKMGNYDVPFDRDGNQMHYAERCWLDGKLVDPLVRPNEPFVDTLVFDTYSRGRSAAYFHFTRLSDGTDVIVFMTDLCKMIPLMVGGKITGTFRHIKRGQNYGTVLLEAQ